MELNKDQLQAEIAKANMIINKLQQKIGQAEGYIAKLEAENEMYREYVLNNENHKKGKEKEKKSKKKEG